MLTVPRLRAEEIAPRIVHHPSDVVVKAGNPAQLSCRAEGSPQVSFEWLRNGQPLQMPKADGQMQPIVLSEGSLFFLSVGEGQRGPSHEGVYTCIARNTVGTAVSRNASLHIAGMMTSTQITAQDIDERILPDVCGDFMPLFVWEEDISSLGVIQCTTRCLGLGFSVVFLNKIDIPVYCTSLN